MSPKASKYTLTARNEMHKGDYILFARLAIIKIQSQHQAQKRQLLDTVHTG